VNRLCILGALLALFGTIPAWAALPQEAYVWQRHWTPALVEALRGSADLVGQWRVLAAEMGAGGHLRPMAADPAALAASGRPVVLVIRIDGQLTGWNQQDALTEIAALLDRWRRGPVPIAGLEIDHDCATARLAGYAAFLTVLHRQLSGTLPLSATALATWLGATNLDRVIDATDEIVLQVHAVLSPLGGLFDAGQARDWIDRLAARTAKPFRVALPAYGARINLSDDGRVLSVESERPLLSGDGWSAELVVAPAVVAGLLKDLDRRPPPHLAGIVWFRLPTAEDRRAWSPATWRAVVRGDPLTGRIEAQARPGDVPGMLALSLENVGGTDALLPRRIEVEGACMLGDGVNGYRLDRQAPSLAFVRVGDGMLREQGHRAIGWLRCEGDRVELHVQP
jgi:hypothetical protein